ncbi:MAG: hypothetical protein KZQ91_05020 [Candidatus Thiodiazotropha sp. (ex Lucinoma borealis)]|nr:hypothetical protein [Candidatus Thiodiazotropha sp. (ex Lucinoma borealis)]
MLQAVIPQEEQGNQSGILEALEVPSIFCWTKMGAEAGQPLSDILFRKELERRASNGAFAWGIGSSLGTAASEARAASHNGDVDVLFTPMKSTPKAIDSTPSQLLLWMSYISPDQGLVDLPPHVLVTSRGGSGKRSHYALLCHSSEDISASRENGILDAARARNFKSLNPIGASQVTSVVHYRNNKQHAPEKPYKIAFRAKLHREGFVRLASPVLLTGTLLNSYHAACSSSSVGEWRDCANAIKYAARRILAKNSNPQKGLFE